MAEQLQRENNYPYEMMPLLFAIIKSTRGNFQEAHRLIQEGNNLTGARENESSEPKSSESRYDEKGNETILDLSTRSCKEKEPNLEKNSQIESDLRIGKSKQKVIKLFRPFDGPRNSYETSENSFKNHSPLHRTSVEDTLIGVSEDSIASRQVRERENFDKVEFDNFSRKRKSLI